MFVCKPENHLLGLVIGHHALQDALQNEILLHLTHTLVQQKIAFFAIDDDQHGLQFGTLLGSHAPQNDVLTELDSNNIFIGVVGD